MKKTLPDAARMISVDDHARVIFSHVNGWYMKSMRLIRPLSFATLCLAGLGLTSASAAMVKAPTTGCNRIQDAESIASARDRSAAKKTSDALMLAHACIGFSQGITVEVEERKPPLACVRLSGDLSCYWVAAVYVDMNGDKADRPQGGPKVHSGGPPGGSMGGTGFGNNRSQGFSIGE